CCCSVVSVSSGMTNRPSRGLEMRTAATRATDRSEGCGFRLSALLGERHPETLQLFTRVSLSELAVDPVPLAGLRRQLERLPRKDRDRLASAVVVILDHTVVTDEPLIRILTNRPAILIDRAPAGHQGTKGAAAESSSPRVSDRPTVLPD